MKMMMNSFEIVDGIVDGIQGDVVDMFLVLRVGIKFRLTPCSTSRGALKLK